MKKFILFFVAILFTAVILTSCGSSEELPEAGNTTEQCDDIKAYEFGREMYILTRLGGANTLSEAISEYTEIMNKEVGIILFPYDENNDCVKRGYSDAIENKASPYCEKNTNWIYLNYLN
jgi:hypothetical protein